MDNKVVGLIRMGGVVLLFIIGIIIMYFAMMTELDPVTGEPVGDIVAVSNAANFIVYLTYGCIGAILIFTIWSIIQNPKKFIPTAIGFGVFAIIAFIGYTMASSAPIEGLIHTDNIAGNVKWGGAGINTTGILVVVAASLIIVGSVMGIMRYFSK